MRFKFGDRVTVKKEYYIGYNRLYRIRNYEPMDRTYTLYVFDRVKDEEDDRVMLTSWNEDELEFYVPTPDRYLETNKIAITPAGLEIYTNSYIDDSGNAIYSHEANINMEEIKMEDILNLYKKRRTEEINKEYNETITKIREEDEIQKIIREMENQVNTLLENEGTQKRLKAESPELLTEETRKKLENAKAEYNKALNRLNSEIEETSALFSLTTDYSERMKILENFGIMKKGKMII